MPIRKRITNGVARTQVSGVGRQMIVFLKKHDLAEFVIYRSRDGFGAHVTDDETCAVFTGVYGGPEDFLKQKGLIEAMPDAPGHYRLTDKGERYVP